MSEPNGLWYGVQMEVRHDEPTTPDNPIKVYYFGWDHEEGKPQRTYRGKPRAFGFAVPYKTLEAAVLAADAHRKKFPNKIGHHVTGRAVSGFVF